MRFSSIVTLIVLVPPTTAGNAAAQAPTPAAIRQGARVRLAVDGEWMSGILARRGRDTLWVRVGQADTLLAAPLARMGHLEVSREQRSNTGRGALAGLVIGSIPGVLAGATCDCGNPGAAIVLMGAFTGGLGAALGAALGATGRHDVWEVVPVAVEAGTGSVAPGVTAVLRPKLR
jgi:hypothetical protein